MLCVELGKPGTLLLLGMGFGCLKLLLSENSDCDSVPAPSKGDRTVKPGTFAGTTRQGLVRPGGGDGESLQGIWVEKKKCQITDANYTGWKQGSKSSIEKGAIHWKFKLNEINHCTLPPKKRVLFI